MAGMLTVAAAIRLCRCGLVAPGHEHDTVERIAVENLHKTEIGKIAIERCRGPLARLLDRMHWELDRDTTSGANPLADPLRKIDMVPIAWREIGAGLGNAYDRLA